MRSITVFLALLVIGVGSGQDLAGQAMKERGPRMAVQVALTHEADFGDESFLILRRAAHLGGDVILLRPDRADPATLTRAVRGYMFERRGRPQGARAPAMIRVRQPAPAKPYPWVDRVLADLRMAEPEPIAGIGEARAVMIWLPRR